MMNGITALESLCAEKGIAFRREEPLGAHCTFGIGGAASLFAEPADEAQIEALARLAHSSGTRLLVLGNGSNMLFLDEGFDGAVLCVGRRFSAMRLVGDDMIECESGAYLKDLCSFACENSLAGLEFAYGIPGSVGGAIYMNAGAYGGEIKDVLAGARHISPQTGPDGFAADEMNFGYRHSAYTGGDLIITRGLFRLRKDDKADIRARMDDIIRKRREKQPLEYPSAGSTFKRPDSAYASELIDRCGLKGRRVGGAMVSEKHAGFVINAGNATGADVRGLIELIKREVKEKTGFSLECEVKIVD